MQDDFGQKGGKVKLVEMGEIGSCFGEDLFTDLCERVEKEGGWNLYEVGKQIQKHLVELCRDRLPERGFTIEATEDEIRGLEFNPFGREITIIPKDEAKAILGDEPDNGKEQQ